MNQQFAEKRGEGVYQKNGAGNRNRTRDTLITNQVLYLLSYTGSKKRGEKQFFDATLFLTKNQETFS